MRDHLYVVRSFPAALLPLFALVCSVPSCAQTHVKPGADVLVGQRLDLLSGKRVGLITNQTGVLSTGETTRAGLQRNGIRVTALFAPEHGATGMSAAGETVYDSVADADDIPVYSLYGKTRKPTSEMLAEVDILVYDLQDVGVRFYTYISTMGLAMEAAAENGIPFVVLDRPNPLGGMRIEGPVLDDSLRSFVGRYPIPVIYGLTCGELALMIVGEQWLADGGPPELHIIPMEGWKRSMNWHDTGLPWIPPSPNIRSDSTVFVYPAVCFFEASNISEGRGTSRPFHQFGAPFLDPKILLQALTGRAVPGVRFETVEFTPLGSKYQGIPCRGIGVHVIEVAEFRPVYTGLLALSETRRLFPDDVIIDERFLLLLLGSHPAVNALLQPEGLNSLESVMETEVTAYREKRKKYLLYE